MNAGFIGANSRGSNYTSAVFSSNLSNSHSTPPSTLHFLWALLPHPLPPQLYTPPRADIFYATLLFALKRSSGTTAQHFRHITLRLVSTVAAQTLDINGVRKVYSSLRLLHLRRSSVTIDPHQATSPPLVCPDSSSRDTQIRRQFGGSSILPFHPTLNERSARPFSCLCFSTSTNI